MSFSRKAHILLACYWLLITPAYADGGYLLGLSGEVDTSDGRAVAAFANYGFTDSSWLSSTVVKTTAGGGVTDFDTILVDLGFEQSFGKFGLRIGVAYWGDEDLLDSNDVTAAAFYRGDTAALTLTVERRDFDFVFSSLLAPDLRRTTEFSADGIGLSGRVDVTKNVSLFANGMTYEYSRNIRIQQRIDLLRDFARSRLNLVNSLIDHRVSVGSSFHFGNRSVDVSVSNWQTAVDGSDVNSLAISYIAPSSPRSDLELRVAYDDSEDFGGTYALSVSFYLFGG